MKIIKAILLFIATILALRLAGDLFEVGSEASSWIGFGVVGLLIIFLVLVNRKIFPPKK